MVHILLHTHTHNRSSKSRFSGHPFTDIKEFMLLFLFSIFSFSPFLLHFDPSSFSLTIISLQSPISISISFLMVSVLPCYLSREPNPSISLLQFDFRKLNLTHVSKYSISRRLSSLPCLIVIFVYFYGYSLIIYCYY